MSTKLLSLLVILGVIHICLAYLPVIERAPVTDPVLKAQGYSCQNTKLGPMRHGEANTNYDSTICGSVTCESGVFSYHSCLVFGVPIGSKIPENPTIPFPQCCNLPKN